MQEAKPSNIHFTLLRAQWTEEAPSDLCARGSIEYFAKSDIDLIAAQDDSLAIGARKALRMPSESEQERWLTPFTRLRWLAENWRGRGSAAGCWAATVFVPPTQAWRSICLPSHAKPQTRRRAPLTVPVSIPALDQLKPR